MSIRNINSVITDIEEKVKTSFSVYSGKKIIYTGKYNNDKTIVVITPQSSLDSNEKGLVDFTQIQKNILDKYDIVLMVFRLPNNKIFYINYQKLKVFLTNTNITYNENASEHWKLHIYPDKKVITIKEKNNKISMENSFTYLVENSIQELILIKDIEEIIDSKIPISTEKQNLIKCRIGQGVFREKLITLWEGCSVTKFENIEILIASHIKPWSKSSNEERIDVYNGLLLTPNLDKLFDKGYISFQDNGKILIAESLKCFELLGITIDMRVSIKDEHKKYLDYHRSEIFKNI